MKFKCPDPSGKLNPPTYVLPSLPASNGPVGQKSLCPDLAVEGKFSRLVPEGAETIIP
jgi:hypothetical protein